MLTDVRLDPQLLCFRDNKLADHCTPMVEFEVSAMNAKRSMKHECGVTCYFQ